jgi:hypothetical protein
MALRALFSSFMGDKLSDVWQERGAKNQEKVWQAAPPAAIVPLNYAY